MAFYVLVTFLQKEAALLDMQVRLAQDGLYTRDNRAKYCRIQTKLNELWTWFEERVYEEGVLSTSELLQGTSEQYSEFRREDSSEKRLQRAKLNDEIDLKFGYERYKEPKEKVGWLINMHPVLVKECKKKICSASMT